VKFLTKSSFIYALCFAGLFFSLLAIVESTTGGVCGDACASAMSSDYAKFFGIPVGCFAFSVWIYLIHSVRTPTKLGVYLSIAMGLGATAFIGILLFILHQSCIICFLHNTTAIMMAICFPVYAYRKKIPVQYYFAKCEIQRWIITSFVLLCLVMVTYQKQEPLKFSPSDNLYLNFPILYSQNSAPSQQNILVVSLGCPHCYKVLGTLLTAKYSKPTYLNIVLKNTQDASEANCATIAAILKLSAQEKFLKSQEAFKIVFPIMYKHSKEMEKGNFLPYIEELQEKVPETEKYKSLATYLLNSYTLFYSELKTQQTPLFIKDGTVVKDVAKMHP